MCFIKTYKRKSDVKTQVAGRDIIVYKIIQKDGSGWIHPLKIRGKRTRWKPGYHYIETTPFATKTIVKKWGDYCDLHIRGHAFHSMRLKKNAVQGLPSK